MNSRQRSPAIQHGLPVFLKANGASVSWADALASPSGLESIPAAARSLDLVQQGQALPTQALASLLTGCCRIRQHELTDDPVHLENIGWRLRPKTLRLCLTQGCRWVRAGLFDRSCAVFTL